ALAEIVREEMFSGRTVDLADLGSFKVVSNGKRMDTEKAVTADTLKTPRIQFFPKLEMRNQAKNVQRVVIREGEAKPIAPSPTPGGTPGESSDDTL
ncbi:HU family DNA-binding protein, partial [Porphyromonas loveana]|uniref:HU family DNA-binding protein n=1 Tax=Porphyromonas loveana TaxID=1884669 RepID=UPI004039188F